MRLTILRLICGASMLAAAALAAPATFVITAGDDQDVVFVSKAPMETFEGRTDRASGTIVADLAGLIDSCAVQITVDLASLDTGLGLRNTHMRERHLQTEQFPHAVFTGGRVVAAQPATLAPGAVARITLAGTFDLHGVVRAIEVPVDLALAADGNVLTARAEFPVLLSDHAIDRPKMLVLKLADEQRVRISLTARRQTTESGS